FDAGMNDLSASRSKTTLPSGVMIRTPQRAEANFGWSNNAAICACRSAGVAGLLLVVGLCCADAGMNDSEMISSGITVLFSFFMLNVINEIEFSRPLRSCPHRAG